MLQTVQMFFPSLSGRTKAERTSLVMMWCHEKQRDSPRNEVRRDIRYVKSYFSRNLAIKLPQQFGFDI